MTRIQKLLVLALILATAAPAMAETAFRLVVQKRGEEAAAGVGVLMADGLLLTSHRLVSRGGQYLVHDPATGARLVATVKAREVNSDLALLSAPGLGGEPVTIAREASEAGRRVYLLVPGGTRREGTLHSIFKGKDEQVRYRFTSIVGEDEAAAPLMNNCDELLAISQSKPSSPGGGDANLGVSGALPALVAFLEAQTVEFETSGEVCPSLQDQLLQAEKTGKELEEGKAALEQQRQQVEEEKAALEQKLEQLKAASSEDQQQNQEQVQKLEANKAALEEHLRRQSQELARKRQALGKQSQSQKDLEEQIERHQEEGQHKDEELAERQREQEELRRRQWFIGIGLGVLLLVAGVLVRRQFRARQRQLRESEQELSAARSRPELGNVTFSDVILAGVGPLEQELRVKVNGNALARSEVGQVIGRSSANADYVIGVDSISREHARLRVDGDAMTIEDMNSLNGTSLDGVRLKPGEALVVRDGARLTLGDVDLVAHFLGDRSR